MKAWVRPKWRVRVFIFLANAAWMAACWFWVERENWLWVTPFALSINFLLLTYDYILHFRSLEGVPVVGHDPWGILKTVKELGEELKVRTPEIYLLHSPSALIFSYAKGRRSRLYMSDGLLRLLTARQLRAVLTFQMITIRSSYDVLNYWLAAVLDMFFRFGRALERAFGVIFGWSPRLSVWVIRPWMWILHGLFLGHADFRRLDRETARALEKPEDLAEALWKLEAYANTRPWTGSPWVFAHMCMVSPLVTAPAIDRVQPPVESRIKELAGRYPL
jgi:hypothetical protein